MTDTQHNPYAGDPVRSIRINEIDFGEGSSNELNAKKTNTRIKTVLLRKRIRYVGDLDYVTINDRIDALFDVGGSILPNISRKGIITMQTALSKIGYQFGRDDQQTSEMQNLLSAHTSYRKNFCAEHFQAVSSNSNDGWAKITFKVSPAFANAIKNGDIDYMSPENPNGIDLDSDDAEAKNARTVAAAIGGNGGDFDPKTDLLTITFSGKDLYKLAAPDTSAKLAAACRALMPRPKGLKPIS